MCNMSGNHFDKVLVIDDDEVDLYITSRVIKSSQFAEEVIQKTNVDDAIEYLASLKNVSQEIYPRIIFLDMKMPGKDGYAFLYEFSELEHLSKSKCTIVLLVNTRPSFQDRKFSSANDLTSLRIIEKPLTVEALRALKTQF
jgi:CheY-like chemotaxis protein